MSYIDELNTLPAKALIDFRKSGSSQIIPVELQQYILQLDKVIQIKKGYKFHNVTRIAEKLMIDYPELNVHTAKKRVYDALAFFHVHDAVSNEVWYDIYAEKMEDIGQLCLDMDKPEAAIKAFALALEYRTKENSQINAEDLKPITYIISNNITAKELGFESKSLKNIRQKDLEGHYVKLINSLDIENDDKLRLMKDANIEEAKIVEEDE